MIGVIGRGFAGAGLAGADVVAGVEVECLETHLGCWVSLVLFSSFWQSYEVFLSRLAFWICVLTGEADIEIEKRIGGDCLVMLGEDKEHCVHFRSNG